MKDFLKIFDYSFLMGQLVKRDIKLKYRRSVLGMLWSVLNPLCFIAITYIVFSTLFKSNIKNFPLYVMSGQLIFAFYTEATGTAMSSIISNGNLIKKVYIPKEVFPVSKILSTFVNTGFSFIALFIVILVTRADIYWTYIFIPLPFFFILIFSIGVGLILSSVAVIFRDTIYLYSVFTTMLSYLSAIFYPLDILPDQIKKYFFYNPIFRYIDYFRQVILYGQVPTLKNTCICAMMALLFLIIGIHIFKRKENEFILYI